MADRLTELRVSGLRSIGSLRLRLDGLTVLIGENGAGKSTIAEACELLYLASQPQHFVEILRKGSGVVDLLRVGADSFSLGVTIEGASDALDYDIVVGGARGGSVEAERLDLRRHGGPAEPLHAIIRDAESCRIFSTASRSLEAVELPRTRLALTAFGAFPQPSLLRVIEVLERVRTHVAFDVRRNAIPKASAVPATRAPARLEEVHELARGGGNLGNCLHALRESDDNVWREVVACIREGLGANLVDIKMPAVGVGTFELAFYYADLPEPIPASALSDGQLAFIAFVVLTRLARRNSLLVFDEPEVHLHPELLVRLVWLFEELAEHCPVVLCTQSDGLLDALTEPAASTVLCELDENHATKLFRPDAERLQDWLREYRGLGALRAEGYARQVLMTPLEQGK
jgi:predicted ATPase